MVYSRLSRVRKVFCRSTTDFCFCMQTVILFVYTIAVPSPSLQAEAWPAQPEGLLSGLGRLVERVALDFGAHAAHFLLNGLPPEHLAMSKPAGGITCPESRWTLSEFRQPLVRPLHEYCTDSLHMHDFLLHACDSWGNMLTCLHCMSSCRQATLMPQ